MEEFFVLHETVKWVDTNLNNDARSRTLLIIDNAVAFNNVFRMIAVLLVAGGTVFDIKAVREKVCWWKK